MINVQLLSHTQNPEFLIASAGKLCYSPATIGDLVEKQTDESVEKFVNMLIGLGHESPLEHASFTFGIEGISRITEIQLVRHRLASYSIQSGRYVKRDSPSFVKPENIANNPLASSVFDEVAATSAKGYNDLFLILMLTQMGYNNAEIEQLSEDERVELIVELQEQNKRQYSAFEKVAIEDARYVHLQSIEVKAVCTMNLRSLINFTRHRECRRAQSEIQTLSKEMTRVIDEKFPMLGKVLGAHCRFGACPEGKMCCGKPYPKKA